MPELQIRPVIEVARKSSVSGRRARPYPDLHSSDFTEWHLACLDQLRRTFMDKDKNSLDDPLGIADQPVPRDANDIHATNDPDEVARRRARALGESDGEFKGPGSDINEDGFGATSIDMGYGGEGNAVKKQP
jgi:hypothetical protein